MSREKNGDTLGSLGTFLSVASAEVSSGIACRGVCCRGRGAGLDEVVQVEAACDERRGLAVRLIQGQRLIPLKVAHHLLKARALIEAVPPKCLHFFYCCATSSAARSTPRRSARA